MGFSIQLITRILSAGHSNFIQVELALEEEMFL